ncbi:hypothetical protein [Methylocella sp. CPCC 101449]|uniref:hypothetical protein n=1 Tax=Methylocella sp. CPCC 101449 TaxID=2987531 RepID=UPI0028922007|nr:hypothetical protein [Methylocella sp. CPCC 101449]MDT2023061.1 hypothetical protein [Methylocella sp. CPCC 101449]HEV2570273.1 hypothetical protein [Beijerinckiaceae bacterium]
MAGPKGKPIKSAALSTRHPPPPIPSAPKRDLERFTFVIQADRRGCVSVTEFDCHATQAEIAQALCDSNLPDCPVLHILEGHIGDMLRDVTEDVAREIGRMAERAAQDHWTIQTCAAQLLRRFDLFDACEHHLMIEYLNQPLMDIG